MRYRGGLTLIELLVVLTLISIMATVAGLALPQSVTVPTDTAVARLFAARGAALRTGLPVVVRLVDSDSGAWAVALPDGSVVADSSAHVDRFTGRIISDSSAQR